MKCINRLLVVSFFFLANGSLKGQTIADRQIGQQSKPVSNQQLTKLSADCIAWGGSGRAVFSDLYTDSRNNVYACGYIYEHTRFYDTLVSKSGSNDGLLIKYDANGKILWLKKFPGFTNNGQPGYPAKTVKVNKVRTDKAGNVYVVGVFQKQLTLPDATYQSAGREDLFLIKYDASGKFIWCRTSNCPHLSANAFASALGVSSNGDVVIAGNFYNTITIGTSSLTGTGNSNVFISVFSATGELKTLTRAEGPGFNQCNDLAIDSKDNLYITGSFNGGNFAFGNAVIEDSDTTRNLAYQDFFLAKYSLPAKSWLWAIREGAPNGGESGLSLCVDKQDNIYATGYCNGFGAILLTQHRKAFVAKYAPDRSKIWEKAIFSPGNLTVFSFGRGIACDAENNVFITGEFLGKIDLAKEKGLASSPATGNQSDIFILKFKDNGALLNSRSFHDKNSDLGLGVTKSGSGELYMFCQNGYNLNSKNPVVYPNLPVQNPVIIKLRKF